MRRVSVTFDEPNLAASAGLLPAALLARQVGLAELVDERLTLHHNGANIGVKALSVIGIDARRRPPTGVPSPH